MNEEGTDDIANQSWVELRVSWREFTTVYVGYEGVAQAGHAVVAMVTLDDKSTHNIPEYCEIKPHTYIHTV